MGQAAYADAAGHFRAALAAREGQEIDDDMAGVLFDLGRVCTNLAEYSDGWRCLRQAFAYYAAGGNPGRAVDIAEFAGTWGSITPTQTGMIERALELADEGSEEYGRLQAVLGYSTGMQGDDARAREAFAMAREVAARYGLKNLELAGLLLEIRVDGWYGRLDTVRVNAAKLIELAAELGDPREQSGHAWLALVANQGLEEARRHADAALALAERSRVPTSIALATASQGRIATEAGDWDSARAVLTRGLELDPFQPQVLYQIALTELLVGESAPAERHIQRMIESMKGARPDGLMAALTAHILPLATCVAGKQAESALVEEAARMVLSRSASPGVTLHARMGLALQAFVDGDREEAQAQLAPLAAKIWDAPGIFSTGHVRGLLFETLDRVDEAIEEMEAVLRLNHFEYRVAYALAAFDAARLRFQRAGPGDRERAQALVNESLAIAQELGMKPLLTKIVALKMRLQGIGSQDVHTSIDTVARQVQSQHPDLRAAAADDGTVTIMFSDIAGSTARAEALGDERWLALIRGHNAIVREQVQSCGGREVANRGDGFMVVFSDPCAAVDCAIAIQRAFQQHGKDPDPPTSRQADRPTSRSRSTSACTPAARPRTRATSTART